MPINRCPECDHEPIPSDANYCPNCASPIEISSSHPSKNKTEARSPAPARTIQEEFKALALDEADVGLTVTDAEAPDRPIIYANNAFFQMTGYSREEVLGNNRRILRGPHTDPDDAEQIEQAVERGHSTEVEILNYRKDDTPFWCLVRIRPFAETEKDPRYYLDIQLDITERKERERTLTKQHDLMLHALEHTNSHTFEIDLETQLVTRHGSFSDLFNMRSDEVPTQDQFVERAVHPEDREALYELYQSLVEGDQKAGTHEFRTNPETGTVRWIRDDVYRTRENPPRIIGLAQDITVQKKANQEIKKTVRRLELAGEAAGVGIWEWNVGTDEVYWDDQTRDVLGVSRDEEGKLSTFMKLVHPEDKDRVEKELESTVSEQTPLQIEYRIDPGPAGKTRWVESRGAVYESDGDDHDMMLGTIMDVTERKQAEQELRRLKEEFETVFSTAQDAIFLYDVVREESDLRFELRRLNPAHEAVTGLSTDEDRGKTPREFLDEETGAEVEENYRRCLEAREPISYEEVLEFPTGSISWHTYLSPVFTDGEVTQIVGVARDITEQKQRERKLRQYRVLTEAARDVIVTIDESSRIQSINPAVYNVFGYSPEELIGEELTLLMPPRFRERHLDGIERYLESGERRLDWDTVEFMGQHQDGSEVPVSISFSEVQHEGERYFTGILRDITDRKEHEQQIERSQREMEQLLGRITDAFFSLDVNWTVTYWNEQAEELIGRSAGDLLGTNIWEAFPVARETKVYDRYHQAMEQQETQHFEYFHEPLEIWLRISAYPSEEGLSVFFQDITNQKEAEQEIKRTARRLEMAGEAADVGIWEWNIETDDLYWDERIRNIFGISPDQTMRLGSVIDMIHPEDQEEVEQQIQEAVQEDKRLYLEYRIVHGNTGDIRWIESRGQMYNRETDEPDIMVGTVWDITEQRKQQTELEKSLERQSTLLQEVHHRVRNNLQNVISLLSLSARSTSEPGAETLLQENVNRVHSISLVHKLLHDAEDLSSISTAEYVQELVETIMEQIDPQQTIQTKLKISPAVQFDADTLPTVGLIVNELISNAVEHAFSDRKKGIVSISLQSLDGSYELTVQDDGQGMDEQYLEGEQYSLGLSLVRNLGEKQLNGSMDISSSDRGTRVDITFPEP